MRTAYDIVKAHYDASDRRDIEGMLADIADDCRWTEMDGSPCAGTYIGRDEIFKNAFMALMNEFEVFTYQLERLLDAGDEVVAIGEYSGKHKHTGKTFKARVAHVWGVADGKVRRFEQFANTLRVAESMR